MGIAIYVDADADPTLPPLLPTAGISGYSGRWIAQTLTGADGSSVASFPAIVGGATRELKNTTSASQPILKVSGVEKWLQFDGVDDFLSEAAIITPWLTTIIVAKIAATGPGALYEGSAGHFASIGNAGLWYNVNAGSGGGGVQVSAGPASARDKWVVASVSQNGAASVVGFDNFKVTGTLGPNPANKLVIGKNPQGVGQVSIAEILTYDTALTGAQLDTVAAALKASHPLLFP